MKVVLISAGLRAAGRSIQGTNGRCIRKANAIRDVIFLEIVILEVQIAILSIRAHYVRSLIVLVQLLTAAYGKRSVITALNVGIVS